MTVAGNEGFMPVGKGVFFTLTRAPVTTSSTLIRGRAPVTQMSGWPLLGSLDQVQLLRLASSCYILVLSLEIELY